MAFRLGTYIATQFKPIVAKTIYDMTRAKTVLDTSMGWGDRLTAFYDFLAQRIILVVILIQIHLIDYRQKIAFYVQIYDKSKGKKTVQIYRCGAEDLPWDRINNVDCAFTSPPYFSTERYNEGGEQRMNPTSLQRSMNRYER